MQAPSTWNYNRIAEVFRERGLPVPDASLVTLSSALRIHFRLLIAVTLSSALRIHFLANGPFITAMARSQVRRNGLSELAVDLPIWPFPFSVVTLENRTLSPVVEHFIENCRAEAKLMGGTVIGKA